MLSEELESRFLQGDTSDKNKIVISVDPDFASQYMLQPWIILLIVLFLVMIVCVIYIFKKKRKLDEKIKIKPGKRNHKKHSRHSDKLKDTEKNGYDENDRF